MFEPSTRSKIIFRRTYNRPKPDGTYETFQETINRCIEHQRFLWERQINKKLDSTQEYELEQLKNILMNGYASLAGRTMWLGGTELSKKLDITQFNCSFLQIRNVYNLVDAYWCLLNGVGVGFEAITGSLFGFCSHKDIIIETIPSTRETKGYKKNVEELRNYGRTWYLKIGDSAVAWAKAVGKIITMKHMVEKIILDFSEIRPPGMLLSQYGWVSSGYKPFMKALVKICGILNIKKNQILDEIDILDIMNLLGETLSSRRSAEICLMDYSNPKWEEFATAKKEFWVNNPHRAQSNNSLMFETKPTKQELENIFKLMMDSGGSEPGFVNKKALKDKLPYFKGLNPCGEVSLPHSGTCNLVSINLQNCNTLPLEKLKEIFIFMARANYRQTLVSYKNDPILTSAWTETNNVLRLCGVSLTGIIQSEHYGDATMFQNFRKWSHHGAHSMADELNTPRSWAITTGKPEGTSSKCYGTPKAEICEGAHKPLGKYIINNINFRRDDPLVEQLRKCNYKIFDNPFDTNNVLISIPVKYDNVKFDIINGKEVNNESAIFQLERYKFLMENYVDHNCSITISYDPTEVPNMIEWLLENWDIYCGVSFIYRNDASKTAKDLGYLYLPQEVITKEEYEAYTATLLPFELDKKEKEQNYELDFGGCATGNCPIR